jgi:uncharacterized protein YukE
MTTTTAYSFALGTVRDFPRNVLPPQTVDSPIGDADKEYRRLLAAYDDAIDELHTLAARGPEAAANDRAALAKAMAAGRPDPGDKATAKLHDEFVAQQRKVNGLADAIDVAYDALRRAIDEHADEFADTLAKDSAKSAERIDTLLAELADEFTATDRTTHAIKWLERALRLEHRRDLPSGTGGTTGIQLSTTSWPREQVFDAIRASVRTPRLNRPGASYGPGGRH